MTPFRRLLALCLLAHACLGVRAEPALPPAPRRWATDHAQYLRKETREKLDAELKAYQQASQHQVILWIGDSLQGVPIEDFSARAMRAWGIGRKKERDGVVFFAFAKDHKLRIEVGYGLEDRLPDAIAHRILDERVVPRLKAGDPDGGITDGVHAILAVLDGKKLDELAASAEAPPAEAQPPVELTQEPPSSADPMGCVVMGAVLAAFLGFLGLIIWQVRKKGGVHWSSGSSGRSTWDSDRDSSSSDSSSSSDDDFSGGGGDSGGGGASSDW